MRRVRATATKTPTVNPPTTSGTTTSAVTRRQATGASDTRNIRQASSTTSGYSTMLSNSTGAASVLNSPPSIPPNDTQK